MASPQQPIQRVLNFNESQTRYLLLNIIGHDVIHDYGNADGKRWTDVQQILKEVYGDPVMAGGAGAIPVKPLKIRHLEAKIQTLQDSGNYRTAKKFEEELKKLGQRTTKGYGYDLVREKRIAREKAEAVAAREQLQKRYEQMNQTTREYISSVVNEVIMSCFDLFCYSIGLTVYHYIWYIYHDHSGSNDASIYQNLMELLLYHFKDTLNTPIDETNFDGFISSVADYIFNPLLGMEELIRIVQYSNNLPDETMAVGTTAGGSKGVKTTNNKKGKKVWVGGARELTDAQAIGLLDALNHIILAFRAVQPAAQLDAEEAKKGLIEQQRLIEPDAGTLRQKVAEEVAKLDAQRAVQAAVQNVPLFIQTMIANATDGSYQVYNQARQALINILKPVFDAFGAIDYWHGLKNIRGPRTDRAFRDFDVDKYVIDVIFKSVAIPLKKANAAKIIQARQEAQAARDIAAALSGDLTSEDKRFVNDFMKLIARMALHGAGIIDANGNVVPRVDITTDPDLQMECQALGYIAGLQGIHGTKDIDGTLIEHFTTKVGTLPEGQRTFRLKCGGTEKYIINNAAPIGSLANDAFCPYTSIIDGMSQCSWQSALSSIEYGNMDFIIRSDRIPLSYNGKITRRGDSNSESNYPYQIDIDIDLQLPGLGQVLGTKQSVDVRNATDLQASNVLKKTLLTIIHILQNIPRPAGTSVCDHLYSNLLRPVDDEHGLRDPIPVYEHIYREILFKGVGDLFQEINAVAKLGGYTGTNSYSDGGIKQWNTQNAVRCFLANDRPSGTRFIFMLLNGEPNQINLNAFGGYYSANQELVVKRPENGFVCTQLSAVVAGGRLRRSNRLTKTQHTQQHNKKSKKLLLQCNRKTRKCKDKHNTLRKTHAP